MTTVDPFDPHAVPRAYIAGPFEDRFRLRVHRDWIRQYYPGTSCAWMDWPEGTPSMPDDVTARRESNRDLAEIRLSQLFILDDTTSGGRGKYVEFGWALGQAIATWVVGESRCVFTYQAERRFSSWGELYLFVEGWKKRV